TDTSLTKKEIHVTAEFVEKEYLQEITNQFKYKGIKFDKTIPLIRSILNSIKTKSIKNGFTFSILIEEKFTQLIIFKSDEIISSVKWSTGLTDIYDYISKRMNIDKSTARKLFKSFGSIPPEDVVDDKVIYSNKYEKEIEIFTKKDLSRYITEKVNELFSNIKSHIDPLKKISNIKIIFNGEIKSLIGFKKYAINSFAEPNIEKFQTKIIGLNEENEFITMGTLIESNNFSQKKDIEEINIPKINVFNKILRMYNYI
ncbi:MAG: hypothetical protein HRS50_01790, partial [Mycoplasmataceae bacterium]|nr:hypothetical protein [Mycoplasmataceae bacterium]